MLNLNSLNNINGLGIKGNALFSPKSISGLTAWYDPNDRSTVLSDGAAQFTASSSQFLKKTSASIALGTNWSMSGWFYYDSALAFKMLFNLGNGAKCYVTTTNQFYFEYNGGNVIIGGLSTGTWYHATCIVEGTTAKVSLNGGAFVTGSGAGSNGTITTIIVGADVNEISSFHDGRIDSLGIWTRSISLVESRWLYNSDSGRMYADLGVAGNDGSDLKTSLVSWYGFNEESGIRYDEHGTNHLNASTSSPAFAAGIASGMATDGNFARNFLGSSSQYLSVPTNASLQTTGTSFSLSFWFQNDLTTTRKILIAKGDLSGSDEFDIESTVGNGVVIGANDSAGGFKSASASALPVGSWSFIVVRYDSVSKKLGISANNGAFTESTAFTGAPVVASNPFRIGAANFSGLYNTGRIDSVSYSKRLYTTAEITFLFNKGKGRKYKDIGIAGTDGSDLKTSLVSWWDMEGLSSSSEPDKHGSNNLTQSGGVTRARGVNYYGGAVSKLLDKSGNGAHLLQSTFARRPVLVLNETTGKYEIEHDGVDDYLVTSASVNGRSFFAVASTSLSTWNSSYRGILTITNNETIIGSTAGGTVLYNPTTAQTSTKRYVSGINTNTFLPAASGKQVFTELSGNMNSTLSWGSDRANASRVWFGSIREEVVYNRVLTTPEINKVGNYLKKKNSVAYTNV